MRARHGGGDAEAGIVDLTGNNNGDNGNAADDSDWEGGGKDASAANDAPTNEDLMREAVAVDKELYAYHSWDKDGHGSKEERRNVPTQHAASTAAFGNNNGNNGNAVNNGNWEGKARMRRPPMTLPPMKI